MCCGLLTGRMRGKLSSAWGGMCQQQLTGQVLSDADSLALFRCPQESGALFLYRKVEKVPEPVLLAAPPVRVTEEEAEEFIKNFNETLESVDPETIAKAAAPAEGEQAAGGPINSMSRRCCLEYLHQDEKACFDLGPDLNRIDILVLQMSILHHILHLEQASLQNKALAAIKPSMLVLL